MSSFARFLNFPREPSGGGSDSFASTPSYAPARTLSAVHPHPHQHNARNSRGPVDAERPHVGRSHRGRRSHRSGKDRYTRACLGRRRALRPGSPRKRVNGRHACPAPHRRRDRPVGAPARGEYGGPETPRSIGAGPRGAHVCVGGAPPGGPHPLHVFEPLVIATTIVATVPLLV